MNLGGPTLHHAKGSHCLGNAGERLLMWRVLQSLIIPQTSKDNTLKVLKQKLYIVLRRKNTHILL